MKKIKLKLSHKLAIGFTTLSAAIATTVGITYASYSTKDNQKKFVTNKRTSTALPPLKDIDGNYFSDEVLLSKAEFSFSHPGDSETETFAKYDPLDKSKDVQGSVVLNDGSKIGINNFVNNYIKDHNSVPVLNGFFGPVLFRNQYLEAVNSFEFAQYLIWFMKNAPWSVDVFSLLTFTIARGVQKEGSMIILGQHTNDLSEETKIEFYPDAFFGSLPGFSLENGDGNYVDSLMFPLIDEGGTLLSKEDIEALINLSPSINKEYERQFLDQSHNKINFNIRYIKPIGKFVDQDFTVKDGYEVYADIYPNLIDDVLKKFPYLGQKMNGLHVETDSNGNKKLVDGEYLGISKDTRIPFLAVLKAVNPDFKGIGIEWLKFVGIHEYGHHSTLNGGQDSSNGGYLGGAYSSKSGASSNSLVDKESFQNYLKARTGLDVYGLNPQQIVEGIQAQTPADQTLMGMFNWFAIAANNILESSDDQFGGPLPRDTRNSVIRAAVVKAINNLSRRALQTMGGLYNAAGQRGSVQIWDLILMNSWDILSGTMNPTISGDAYYYINQSGKLEQVSNLASLQSVLKDGLGNPITFQGTEPIVQDATGKTIIFKRDGTPIVPDNANANEVLKASNQIKSFIASFVLNFNVDGWEQGQIVQFDAQPSVGTRGLSFIGDYNIPLAPSYSQEFNALNSRIYKNGNIGQANDVNISPNANLNTAFADMLVHLKNTSLTKSQVAQTFIANQKVYISSHSTTQVYINASNGQRIDSTDSNSDNVWETLFKRLHLYEKTVDGSRDSDKLPLVLIDSNNQQIVGTSSSLTYANFEQLIKGRTIQKVELEEDFARMFMVDMVDQTNNTKQPVSLLKNTVTRQGRKGEYYTVEFNSIAEIIDFLTINMNSFTYGAYGESVLKDPALFKLIDQTKFEKYRDQVVSNNWTTTYGTFYTEEMLKMRYSYYISSSLWFYRENDSINSLDTYVKGSGQNGDYGIMPLISLNNGNDGYFKSATLAYMDAYSQFEPEEKPFQKYYYDDKNVLVLNPKYAEHVNRFKESFKKKLANTLVHKPDVVDNLTEEELDKLIFQLGTASVSNYYALNSIDDFTIEDELEFSKSRIDNILQGLEKYKTFQQNQNEQNFGWDSLWQLDFSLFSSVFTGTTLSKSFVNTLSIGITPVVFESFLQRIDDDFSQRFANYVYTYAELINRDVLQIVYVPSTEGIPTTPDFISPDAISESNSGFEYFIDGSMTRRYIEATKENIYSPIIGSVLKNVFISVINNLPDNVRNSLGLSSLKNLLFQGVQPTYVGRSISQNNGFFKDDTLRRALKRFIPDPNNPGNFIADANDNVGWSLYNLDGTPVQEVSRLESFEPGRMTQTRPEAIWVWWLRTMGIHERTLSGIWRSRDRDTSYVYGYIPNSLASRLKGINFVDRATGASRVLPVHVGQNNLFYIPDRSQIDQRVSVEAPINKGGAEWTSWTTDLVSLSGYSNSVLENGHSYIVTFVDENNQEIKGLNPFEELTLGNRDYVAENGKQWSQAPVYFENDRSSGQVVLHIRNQFSL